MSSRKSFALPVNVQTRRGKVVVMIWDRPRDVLQEPAGGAQNVSQRSHVQVASDKWQVGKVQVPPFARMRIRKKPRARASRFSSPLDLIKKSSPVSRTLHEGTQQAPFLALSQGRQLKSSS
jgi:hypothetical protein